MLSKILYISLMIFGWVALTPVTKADSLPFLPPNARVQLEANKIWPQNNFLVIAYHDVEDDAADQRYLSVRTSALSDQISWLIQSGYNAVSVQDILDAHAGIKILPPKAFLLSFDDGYSSFYRRVWPLLVAYNVPALWAPVGSWVDAPAGQEIDFGGLLTPRDRFSNWEQVKELSRSPLVEIGAHTWASHYGILANPQGSHEPAVANRYYNMSSGHYEGDSHFKHRIERDVSKVTNKIREITGKSPRAWVWPYGAANGTSLSIVKSKGYKLAFTLDDGLANIADLDNIPRLLISGNPSLKEFSELIGQVREHEIMRVMFIDLDQVYNKDLSVQSRNIDKLIQRVFDMKITHVYLKAYSTDFKDGKAKSVYFPNRWLPMRADLFNYISWQLQTRTDIKVYAWLPVLSFDFTTQQHPQNVSEGATSHFALLDPYYRNKVNDIYGDISKNATFDGIVFDGYLASDNGVCNIHQPSEKSNEDNTHKENVPRCLQARSLDIVSFTNALIRTVKNIRGPQIKTARIISAPLPSEYNTWISFDNEMALLLKNYDWVIPLINVYSENINDQWLTKLVNTVTSHRDGITKTIFEIKLSNKDSAEISPDNEVIQLMEALQINGVNNYGYYPDDFTSNRPDINKIKPLLSSRWYPDYK